MTHRIEDATAFPLSWPIGQRRTPRTAQRRWRGTEWGNDLRLGECLSDLGDELRRLGVRDGDVVVSMNRARNLNGSPRANASEPEDRGVAVWFKLKGEDRVMACDAWATNAQNVRAVVKTIHALRGVERWGACDLRQAFAGYAALPPAAAPDDPWPVLGLDPETATEETVRGRYRELAKERHPDQPGGSEAAMAALTEARDRALREVKS